VQKAGIRIEFADVDGETISFVSFSRQSIEEEAKKFGGNRFSLMDEHGRYWIWDDYYDALVDTASHRLIVVSSPEPSKRGGAIGDQQYSLHKNH
jgi:hypothetical protein